MPQPDKTLNRLVGQVTDTNIIALEKMLCLAQMPPDGAVLARAISIRDRMEQVAIELAKCL